MAFWLFCGEGCLLEQKVIKLPPLEVRPPKEKKDLRRDRGHHTWARVGGTGGQYPPGRPKKCSPLGKIFLFTAFPLPAACGGRKFCYLKKNIRKNVGFGEKI